MFEFDTELLDDTSDFVIKTKVSDRRHRRGRRGRRR